MIFNHLKRGNARKKVCSPYIKSKEVNPQGARKNRHKKINKIYFVCVACFAVALRRKSSASALLAMKEKIEILRNLAEAMLDEIAEIEVLISESAEIFPNVGDSVISGG